MSSANAWKVRNPLRSELLLVYLILLMNLQMLSNMFSFGFRVSSLVPNLVLLLIGAWLILFKRFSNAVDIAVFAFLLINISSILFYFQPGHPVDVLAIFYGMNICIIPVLTYFVARMVPANKIDGLIRAFVYFSAAVFIFFFVLHLGRPAFYSDYLFRSLQAAGVVEEWQAFARMQGYLGSTAVGAVACICIWCLAFVKVRSVLFFPLAVVFLFAVALTLQRSSMVIAVLAFSWVIFRRPGLGVPSLVGIIIAVFVAISMIGTDILELGIRIFDRLLEAIDALSYEDRVSYQKVWPVMEAYPIGMGVGATTSAVDSAGLNPGGQIVDANHMRILADVGMLGLLAFFMPVFIGLSRLLDGCRIRGLTLGLMLLTLNIQATGTNTFDSYYVAHIYWAMIGFLATETGLNYTGTRQDARSGPPVTVGESA